MNFKYQFLNNVISKKRINFTKINAKHIKTNEQDKNNNVEKKQKNKQTKKTMSHTRSGGHSELSTRSLTL
jgi:hypothetical protein